MTTWMKWARQVTSLSRISFGDQSIVHFCFCTMHLRKEFAITGVARIIYHSFHFVFLSGRMSGVLETVSEDWKNRRNWERSEGHFGKIFWYKLIHLFVYPTWGFKHHSRLFPGFLMFNYIGWIYSRSLAFSTSFFRSNKQSVQCLSGNIVPCNYFLQSTQSLANCANVPRDLELFAKPRFPWW